MQKKVVLNAPDVYMDKITWEVDCPNDIVSLDEQPEINIKIWQSKKERY